MDLFSANSGSRLSVPFPFLPTPLYLLSPPRPPIMPSVLQPQAMSPRCLNAIPARATAGPRPATECRCGRMGEITRWWPFRQRMIHNDVLEQLSSFLGLVDVTPRCCLSPAVRSSRPGKGRWGTPFRTANHATESACFQPSPFRYALDRIGDLIGNLGCLPDSVDVL